MPVTALLGVCYHSIHLLYIFIFIYSFYLFLYIFSHFILLVQPFLEKTFCYWYRNCSRNWPPFLACLPISFPGRILVLSYGKGMAGQHQRVKRRVSSFNAIWVTSSTFAPCSRWLDILACPYLLSARAIPSFLAWPWVPLQLMPQFKMITREDDYLPLILQTTQY